MKDQEKSKEQLLYEIGEMRRRISELESAVETSRSRLEIEQARVKAKLEEGGTDPTDADSFEGTQTIDLATVFTADVTASGSFSFSGVRQTWFGRLLQALPIPAFLIDGSYSIIFMNGACGRVSPDYASLQGRAFSALFENPWFGDEAQHLMEKVFSKRLRESMEAVLRINKGKIWGRLYMRSIRLGTSRCVLVLVEDLTLEKEQLVMKQKHEEQILKERDDLEQRVQVRTHELVAANEELQREIVERELAQKQLIEREARYRLLVENSPVGIISCDTLGIITELNPAVLNILDIPSFEAAKELNLLCHEPLFDSGISGAISKCMESNRSRSAEFMYGGEGIRQRYLRVHVVPVLDGERQIAGVQAVVEDISEHKRADGLLLRSERLRALVEMASGVAHNFNSSLQAVATDTQMAISYLESGSFSQMRPLLEQILDNAHQTAKTVRRLKQFARSRTSVATSEIKVFDASDAIREGIEKSKRWWKADAENRGMEISLLADCAEDCHIEGDFQEVVEMVMILLRNSAEALVTGGVITVRCFVENEHVVVQVKDDGIGIPKTELEKIFEPFWTSKTSHVGMGLAVGSGIVRRHQGTLAVTSKDGQGTRITVKLPHAVLEKREEDTSRAEFSFPDFRILMISNDTTLLAELEQGLKDLGQTPFVASTGPEGVKIFDENEVDAIVCDNVLQSVSALEVIQAIREIADAKGAVRPRMVLLVDPAERTSEDVKVPPAEVDRIVEKPVTEDQILEVIEEEARKVSGQATFSGSIHGIDILEYVQLLIISGQRVVVEIVSRDGLRGLLYVDEGTVLHAVCDELEGEDALFRCLGFNGGSFSSLPWHEPYARTINKPGELLLLEAARLRDEMNERMLESL
jgi:two-component system cell cycle sensor histidine kinase/response regulator CckA